MENLMVSTLFYLHLLDMGSGETLQLCQLLQFVRDLSFPGDHELLGGRGGTTR